MKFGKLFLATLLAVIVGSVISFLFWVIAIFSLAGSFGGDTKTTGVLPESILKIDMAENITDAAPVNPFSTIDFMSLQSTPRLQLISVLRGLEAAKNDSKIKGIYLNFTGMGSMTLATMEEFRNALIDFKSSGKFIVAYNESYNQVMLYLASVADKICINPEGGVDWRGMGSSIMFYKGAMDKLGLTAEVFRPSACKFKSAVEPYFRTNMSEPNREQMETFLGDFWTVICGDIAKSRGVDADKLDKLATDFSMTFPEDAVAAKLVDKICYEDQMADIFAEYGVKRGVDDEFETISFGTYCKGISADDSHKDKIGIIYAEGEIYDGTGMDDNIYSADLVKVIKNARKDKSIKAVVLRVNSPGGSALASDVIWRELDLLKAEKPVIVSMGGYAASGGYYISSGADAIVADRLTLTGSIGVFGLLVEGSSLLENKLGITTDSAKTNPSADFGTGVFGVLTRKCTNVERENLLRSVDKVYTTFTGKVAAGRNLELEKVLNIAEGRVWSGTRAVELGLADANGGLLSAIAVAAEKAGLEKYSLKTVVGDSNPFAAFASILNSKLSTIFISAEQKEVLEQYAQIKREITRSGVQMYNPTKVQF